MVKFTEGLDRHVGSWPTLYISYMLHIAHVNICIWINCYAYNALIRLIKL